MSRPILFMLVGFAACAGIGALCGAAFFNRTKAPALAAKITEMEASAQAQQKSLNAEGAQLEAQLAERKQQVQQLRSELETRLTSEQLMELHGGEQALKKVHRETALELFRLQQESLEARTKAAKLKAEVDYRATADSKAKATEEKVPATEAQRKEVLAAKIKAGELHELLSIPFEGHFPNIFVEPSGRFAVIDAPSGLRLLDLADVTRDDVVYRCPNEFRAPEHVTGAATEQHLALAWTENTMFRDQNSAEFMVVNLATRRGLPVDLKRKSVRHLAVCPMPGEEWLLAYSFVPDGITDFLNPDILHYGLLFLDNSGKVIEEPLPFSVPGQSTPRHVGGIAALEKIPDGVAAALVDGSGVWVVIADESLATKKRVCIGERAYYRTQHCQVGLAYSEGALCVLWLENQSLHVRTLKVTGENLSQPIRLTQHAHYGYAGPAAVPGGFVLIFDEETADKSHELRTMKLSLDGKAGQTVVLRTSTQDFFVVGLGADAKCARTIFFDYSGMPKKVWLKQFELGKLPKAER
ncbi:MAG TPA: cell envelope integrity protein TolA [Planctomycetota bacterium]